MTANSAHDGPHFCCLQNPSGNEQLLIYLFLTEKLGFHVTIENNGYIVTDITIMTENISFCHKNTC